MKRLQEISAQILLKKEEAKKVEALKKEAESLREKITAIDNFKHDRIMTMNILRELTSILPKNAWLSRARIASSSVDIEGYAGKATELLPKLEASKYFRTDVCQFFGEVPSGLENTSRGISMV